MARSIRVEAVDDRLDLAGPGRRQHDHRIAHLDRAARNHAGKAAEVLVRPVHPLHRHAERPRAGFLLDRHRLEVLHQRRALVPGHALAAREDVVAVDRRHRDAQHVLDADLGRERAIVGLDPLADLLRVVHEVHLVDREHDLLDAEQRHHVAVAPGLREHALACVDQDDRQVGGGRAGDHVAGVLLVPRRVGDDVLAAIGGEEAVGDVDGDALLALGRQAVHEQREIDLAAARARLPRVDGERRELVLEERLALEEQAADQRGLAVVDAAARDETQQPLALLPAEVGFDFGVDHRGRHGHQKYPSTFFFSIDAD